MNDKILKKIEDKATVKNQYERQLSRIQKGGVDTAQIEKAVEQAITKFPDATTGSLVIYGDPQSGKTEMMICLTARLIDEGHNLIVHLMTDNVELLTQSLDRFRRAGLSPAPRDAAELKSSPLTPGHPAILFCKKNASNLKQLLTNLKGAGPVVVMDDEADYATPNAKVNQNEQTKINRLVGGLIGDDGVYVGVTATPARLNLNNTFNNKAETWVNFPPHKNYTGADTFFPQSGKRKYCLTLLDGNGDDQDAHLALANFMVAVAHLNTTAIAKGEEEQNYSFLVHTSGKKDDHQNDRETLEKLLNALVGKTEPNYSYFLELIHRQAQERYPKSDPIELTSYVLKNASRNRIVVLNSNPSSKSAGEKPTEPTCPFTLVIGGNIVSRGVTFPNLLSMYFTRDVKSKLQQDTYIQRARMFGARGKYLEHFELTIPRQLYADWQRCFDLHRLSLAAIKDNNVSPVWIEDNRIAVAAPSSIDRATVDFANGEMRFPLFDLADHRVLDDIIVAAPSKVDTLKQLAKHTGASLPKFLLKFLEIELRTNPDALAVHTCSSIAGYKKADGIDIDDIYRKKGFMGKTQLEEAKFPNAIHHVKIFYNAKGKARVFYKSSRGIQFVLNLNG